MIAPNFVIDVFATRFWKQIPSTDQQNHISQCTVSPNITTHHKIHCSTYSDSMIVKLYPYITRYHHVSLRGIYPHISPRNSHPALLSHTTTIHRIFCQQKYTAWPSHKFWYDVTNASQHSNLRFGFKNLSSTQHDGVNSATSATLSIS